MLRKGLLAFVVVLAIGVMLIAIPYSGPRTLEVVREGVALQEDTGSASNIDLRRGVYEVCVEDKNPGVQDYGSLVVEIERHDTPVAMESSDGSIIRDIDGVPCEVVCRFTITHKDMYWYDISIIGTELNGTFVDLVIIREATRLDQPTFLVGIALVVVSLVTLPLVIMLLRQQAHRPRV